MEIKIIESNLAIREVSTIFPAGWKAIKVTREQAMRFNRDDEVISFDELVEKYGSENIINEGEMYTGYVVAYSPILNQLLFMCGMVKKATNSSDWIFARYATQQAFQNGTLYEVLYQQKDEKCSSGSLKYVWPFGSTLFEKVTTVEKAETLKAKLIKGAVSQDFFEITDEENTILRKYLGSTYYNKFFIVKK